MSLSKTIRKESRKKLENHLETRLIQVGIEMEREVEFHPERKWKFDFADVENKIAMECEGGTWVRGRHTRGKGYAEDCRKYNEAARLGWRVFRFTGDMVLNDEAVLFLEEVYNEQSK